MTKYFSCALRGRADGDWHNNPHQQRLEIRGQFSNSISTVGKDFLLLVEFL